MRMNVLLFRHYFLTCASLFPFYSEEEINLRYALFVSETGNAKNSTSVYKYVKDKGIVDLWIIEDEMILTRTGRSIFDKNPDAPILGSDEVGIHQPFCKDILTQIVKKLKLEDKLLVLGDDGGRKEEEVYADIRS